MANSCSSKLYFLRLTLVEVILSQEIYLHILSFLNTAICMWKSYHVFEGGMFIRKDRPWQEWQNELSMIIKNLLYVNFIIWPIEHPNLNNLLYLLFVTSTSVQRFRHRSMRGSVRTKNKLILESNKPALFQIMAYGRRDDKPLPCLMLTQIYDAIRRH